MKFKQPSVVVGDPSLFSVLFGSNPHTRTMWGVRKRVDREVASRQWTGFIGQLKECGVGVHVIPGVPECPGLVYPANAGIISGKTFYPSNLLPARAPERPHYERFFRGLGFEVEEFGGGKIRFEGEAEFFPWGDRMIFTHGKIERQRTVLSRRFPFYRRRYGFRSEIAALSKLRAIAAGREVIDLELCDERYYHGDTCLCSFGARREHLMAYLPALTVASREKLSAAAGENRLIELTEADASCYAANAFSTEISGVPHLFITSSASRELKSQISDLGVRIVEVDVSEFLKKGGGSVKCMVFDLSGSLHIPSEKC